MSGLIRGGPEVAVAWVDGRRSADLFVAATILYEVTYGPTRLRHGRKRERLEAAREDEVTPLFGERALPLDAAAARTWGRITVEAERRGRTPPLLDSQIAAIAAAHRMTVVTLDRRGFGDLGCELLVLG